jgi:chitinase
MRDNLRVLRRNSSVRRSTTFVIIKLQELTELGFSDTGNPGTRQPGTNGCISNCGTNIVTSASPATFERIGYYEAFNFDRPCGHVSVNAIPDRYTIVHWAFASISSTFRPSVSPYEAAWASFKQQTRFKRIVSFGGWTFSTAVCVTPVHCR